jgi:hypothetical protein
LGPTSILKDITQDPLHFIDTWSSKGLPVNRIALMRKARSLIPELETKSKYAVKQSISRWMTKHRLVHRMATHKAQRHPSEVEGEALQFLDYIRPILQERNRDPDYIINMDQTPVFHAMDFCTTIDRVGTRTVNLRTLGCSFLLPFLQSETPPKGILQESFSFLSEMEDSFSYSFNLEPPKRNGIPLVLKESKDSFGSRHK